MKDWPLSVAEAGVRVAVIRSRFGMGEARGPAVLATIRDEDARPVAGRQPFLFNTPLLRVAPLRLVLELVSRRPDIVVVEDLGFPTLVAGLYRAVSRRGVLLVCLPQPHGKLRAWQRLLVRCSDGVLLNRAVAERAFAEEAVPSHPVSRLAPAPVNAAFVQAGLERTGYPARRLVVANDLSPQSGAADLVPALLAWLDRNPDEAIEIDWVGEGDLAGVLAAQPLPPNLTQRFLGRLTDLETAAVFARCGMLVLTSTWDDGRAPVADAMASGLAVLGNSRSRAVRRHVIDGVTGWLFDPRDPSGLQHALGRALDATPGQRADMHARMRGAWQPQPPADVLDQLRRRPKAAVAGPMLARIPGTVR